MTRYSTEFKDNIIKQMLPPVSKSATELHKETGVSEQTLYKWKRQATPSGKNTSEDWSSEDKFMVVLETAALLVLRKKLKRSGGP